MKRRNGFIMVILVSILVGSLYAFYNKKNVNKFDNDSKVSEKAILLSYMMETSSGSGEYEETTSSKWPSPSDGYVFNETLSKCQNGSSLSWNNDINSVVMTGNVSDKCYIYFDVVKKPVIDEVILGSFSATTASITINATKGAFDISKYYYSIDGGSSWNESTSNVINITGLTKGTAYTIKAYVEDTSGETSEYKSLSFTTSNVLSPYDI